MRKVIGIGETIYDIIFRNGQPTAGVPGDPSGSYTYLKFVDTETGGECKLPIGWASMRPEQRYRTILSVAPCIGSYKELTVQEGDPLIGIELTIRAIWMFDGEIFEKTATATVHAVNVDVECEEEDIQNYAPLQ